MGPMIMLAACDDDACEIDPVFSPGGDCFRPATCCGADEGDLAAACDAAFPQHVAPVACTNGDAPPGLDCRPLPDYVVPCIWGDSAVLCCRAPE